MRRPVTLCLVVGIAAIAVPIRAALPAELQPLSFLLGDWKAGANTGSPGEGTGTCEFRPALQDRVIVRTNHAEYPPSGDRPAAVQDDLMILYAADGGAVGGEFAMAPPGAAGAFKS